MNIQEFDATGIGEKPATEAAYEKSVYSVDGKSQSAKHKGLNIVRMSDGTTKKVMVK